MQADQKTNRVSDNCLIMINLNYKILLKHQAALFLTDILLKVTKPYYHSIEKTISMISV